MAHRDLIVMGASSGGVEALTKVIGGLPPDLPAAVFVVLHVLPERRSMLPAILNRAGTLPAAHAVDGERIRLGRIYVAAPGLQTYICSGTIAVRRGPAENLHRPAIDPVFRTAAHHYGPRVVGVVLSGALDDGTAGLQAIKSAGGLAIVQDPDDARVAGMPGNALERVPIDYCVAVAEIGPLLRRLIDQPAAAPDGFVREVPLETVDESAREEAQDRLRDLGQASGLTCHDCSGAIRQIHDGQTVRYRCRVGHAYSPETMIKAHGDAVERALWTAVRSLEERAALVRRLAVDARDCGLERMAAQFETRASDIDRDATLVHDLLAIARALEPATAAEV